MERLMGKTLLTGKKKDISVVLCGQAGQGIQTVEFLLTRVLKLAGYNVFATKEYMSRIRGGANSTEIRISAKKVSAMVDRIDILIALDKGAMRHVKKRMSTQTLVLAEKEIVGSDLEKSEYTFFDVPFTKIAIEIGSKIYSNIVAVGTITALFSAPLDGVTSFIKQFFSAKSREVIENNIKAAEAGYKFGRGLVDLNGLEFAITANPEVKNEILLGGAEAVALGAIAGGCNFVSSYPMSPSTPVLTFLAKYGRDFGIIVEQAEDEIAAMNMAIGAWYAGARAMVTTSGGGFALMIEGLSLAGMLEMPMVIHLGQRPGPATGLPTRTEQADLNLALYAGHGEFPRIILTPGTLEEGFYLTQKAFNLADKYQVPVFILTDQYFIDSYYNIPSLDLSALKVEKYIIKTSKEYKRYQLTSSGISTRGIPGLGEGLVVVDSDEHDEEGHITEDLDLRVKMVNKRLGKTDLIKNEIIPPELAGPRDYGNLVVCWGSTYNIVKEALVELGRDDTAFLHYKQVFPLHTDTADYLRKADKSIIVEGNATGQLGNQIKLHTGIDIDDRILKYSGLSFSVEEVAHKLKAVLD
jgi:2-oxoglutarate ferredoxin oxidoreductase subunit alpha